MLSYQLKTISLLFLVLFSVVCSGTTFAASAFDAAVNNAKYAMSKNSYDEAIKYWMKALDLNDGCNLCRRGVFRSYAEKLEYDNPEMATEFLRKAVGLGDYVPVDEAFNDLMYLAQRSPTRELGLDTTAFILKNWDRRDQLSKSQLAEALMQRGEALKVVSDYGSDYEEAAYAFARAIQILLPLPQYCPGRGEQLGVLWTAKFSASSLYYIIYEDQTVKYPHLASKYQNELQAVSEKLEQCHRVHPDHSDYKPLGTGGSD